MMVTAFGREIKRFRTALGLTVRQLGDRLGKSPAYIGKIESQGEIPSIDVITALARILNADTHALLLLAKESLLARYEAEIDRRHHPILATLPSNTGSGAGPERKEKGRMATTVSLINMKGGVGKTTLAMQLAHAADRSNLRVLAVDLDPQANMSQSLMGPKPYVEHLDAKKPTIVQVFDGYAPAGPEASSPHRVTREDIIIKKAGYWSDTTLDLVPSRLELAHVLKNCYGRERRLAKWLSQCQDQYDLIVLDCPPTESMLTDAAYFASRYIIVPIKPEFMATIGLPLLAKSLSGFQHENDDQEIDIAGLVFNHSSSYTSGPEGQQSIKEVTDFARENKWHVCENQVKYSASYAKSAREGTPIGRTSYARSEVSQGFDKLKDEIFGLIGVRKGTT